MPDLVRAIAAHKAENRGIWRHPWWRLQRALFLSRPENRLCSWGCGRPATTVCHPPGSWTYGRPEYVDPIHWYGLCDHCTGAERFGYKLCPKCKENYLPEKSFFESCFGCLPERERQEILGHRRRFKRQGQQIKRQISRNIQKIFRSYRHPCGSNLGSQRCNHPLILGGVCSYKAERARECRRFSERIAAIGGVETKVSQS